MHVYEGILKRISTGASLSRRIPSGVQIALAIGAVTTMIWFVSIGAVAQSVLEATTRSQRLDPVAARVAEPPATLPNGIAAGDLTATSGVLWAHSTATGTVTFTYAISGTSVASPTAPLSVPVPTLVQAQVTDAGLPVTVTVDGLEPQTVYAYGVTNAAGEVVTGHFRTPALVGIHTGLRFGVSGDWQGELSPYPAIGNVPDQELDFFVALGDTIYADVPSPAVPGGRATTLGQFRLKHNEVYGTRFGLNSWAGVRGTTALLAMIDDHEVTNDFAGGWSQKPFPAPFDNTGAYINETLLFSAGLRAFHEFNPIVPASYGDTGDPRTQVKRKLYRYRTFGSDAALFLVDSRSFRDKPLDPVTSLAGVARFLIQAFDPTRTFLGAQQLADLKADLLEAQEAGITWKFILVPEPIQNLTVALAEDRFEGYAAERTQLLRFIDTNALTNVVFVAADIHGTIVNNLTYQEGPGLAKIPMDAFEITTGSVAKDKPFGPTIVDIAVQLGLLTQADVNVYNGLPVRSDPDDVVDDKDDFVKSKVNGLLELFRNEPIGLAGSSIPAQLIQGDYMAVHTFGWTEFAIDRTTQQLTVTTYGIPAYSAADLAANPSEVTQRMPAVVSQFVVTPVLEAPPRKYLYLPLGQK